MYPVTRLACAAIACSLLFTAGCNQSTKNVWKDTKRYYGTYMNPPASINYDEKGELEAEEARLATSMLGIDMQLRKLERALENADKKPTPESVARFFKKFPWVAGIAAIDPNGNVLAQEPSLPMKPLSFAETIKEDPKQNIRALRGSVVDSPLGPEVYLAVPVYNGTTFLGAVATHFDMRALLPYSAKPEDLMIAAPGIILWPGKYDAAATPVATTNWEEVARNNTSGTVSNANGEFYWIARYVGNVPLIFAVPVKGTFPEKPEQLSVLATASSLGAPISAQLATPMTEADSVLGETDESLLLRPAPKSDTRKPSEAPIR